MVLLIQNMFLISVGLRSAGFLAYLSGDVEGSDNPYVHFNNEVFDYDDNYDPTSGLYEVPSDGLYLVQSWLEGICI